MLTKGNVSIGLETRFGPNWPGKRCGARTKTGGECQRPAVKKTGRCTRHGGKSTGPRTQAGRDKIAARHTIHGRFSKENRLASKKRAQTLRKINKELKEIETNLIDLGALDKNWRKFW
ncbi:MAG: HGGxSTG domain-containing protein [Candidatus Micropelagos thuwalensis]